MKIAAVDFETANSSPASICSVGVSTLEDGTMEEAYYSLIRPEANVDRFDYRNIRIHGIHPEDVIKAPEFSQVYHHLTECFSGSIVCAHNACFDMGCLKAACINTGRKVPCIEYFDTLELSRRVFPDMRHHRLNDMCDCLGIELNHHNAMSDADGCLQIVIEIMNRSGIYDIKELLYACHVGIHEL
jgi:DNA polymerase-3 subunit epsilon